jgi:hypothetical protein
MSQTVSPDRPSRRTMLAVGVNAGAALAGVAAWDVWRRTRPAAPKTHVEGTVTQGFYRRVDDVGRLPQPNRTVTARRVSEGRAVYDVVYTTDAHGFRAMPPPDAQPQASVLLFGDSNTFGEGVNDNEAYPWQLAERSGGRIEAHNFGVPGWGPHQMLAGLQSGRFARSLQRPPTHAVFLLIDDHVVRAAGEAPWDVHGPRFRLVDGRAVRDGNFDSDGPRPTLDRAEKIALTVAILVEAAREIGSLPRHLLYWNDDTALLDSIARPLTEAGWVLHTGDDFLPGYRRRWEDYVLSEVDWHPNAAAHRAIADYVARRIVGAGR